MPPTLSIVTPSYNQAAYLDQTLRSVISQRGEVHEYFVYDAASTDGSVNLIQRHARQINYCVSEKDKGQSDAIMRGFARATGDYVAWLNSDDVYLPGALARVRAALAANPHWDVVSGWHVRIDGQSRVLSAHRTSPESAAAARRGVFHPNQPTVFFRRSLYEEVGGLNRDLHLVMDTDLFFRMLDAGAVWGHVPAYVAAFRRHEESKGVGTPDKYAGEYGVLDRRYPHYHARSLAHYLGRAAHKGAQWLSGRELASRRDTRRWRGRPIEQVFGEWVTPADGPADNRRAGAGETPVIRWMRYVFFNAGSWERNPSMMRLRELGREMIARGVDVTYAVDDVPYNREHLDVDPKANVVFSPRPTGLAQVRSRRKTLAGLGADFVHILNPSPRTWAGLWGSRLRVVGDWDEWPALRPGPLAKRLANRYLDHWMRHRPVLTVVASKYMTEEFRRRYGMDPLYLPYATYIADMPAGASPFTRPTAVSMGAFFGSYDHDILFEAARLLKASGETVPMTFIGDGPEWAQWRAFVDEHKLDNVEMKGYVDDDQRWLCLRNAHVLMFPIRVNPANLARCPAKTFAYAQARRPVIANRVGEVPEVLGEKATYVEPTAEAFAAAISEAMRRPQPDVDYGVEAHNWAARADKLLGALRELS